MEREHAHKRVSRVQASLKALVVTLLLSPVPGGAVDGTVRVHQSTFNELAAAVSPLTASGRHVIEHWNVVICGKWEAAASNFRFTISPSGVSITGDVSARYHCADTWIPFSATLTSSGNVTYSTTQHAIRVTTSSTSLRPFFTIPDWVPGIGGDRVNLPFTIDVGPTFSFSVPVGTANLHFETAAGPERLRVTPHNVSLQLESTRIRLQSDVSLW